MMLEDEFHFVLECTRYNDLRQTLILNYYQRRPNMFKLIELFESDVKKIQRNLAPRLEIETGRWAKPNSIPIEN